MLANCKDPALKMLKSKGYNVVQLPKSDLRPTQLLVRKGKRLQRIGEIDSVFSANAAAPVPPISADNPNSSISGTKSADIDIGVGLNILGGLISALGGSTLALNVGYSRARSVQFEFADTLENNCQVALLDQFLTGATVNPFARAVTEMLESDDVYVITSTLKSKKINVVAKDDQKTNMSVDVPVIQQAIGGNVKVAAVGVSSSFVTYEGHVPLIFGFQAIRLIFDGGKYRTMKLVDSGSVALEAQAPGGEVPPPEDTAAIEDGLYLTENRLVSLDFG